MSNENLEFVKVSCDGTEMRGKSEEINLNSRHPLIYMKVPYNKKVYCPYCGKEFFSYKDKGK